MAKFDFLSIKEAIEEKKNAYREEKKLSYLEWRDMMERRYDVMPLRYFREAQIMYHEYLNNEAHD